MTKYILAVVSFLLSVNLSAQCDTLMISESNYSLVKVSSLNGTNGGELTFDNKNNTRWRTKGNGPHEIVFDLGKPYDINGFSTSTPFNHRNGSAFNSNGFNYQGYNSNGYNYNGYNSAMNYLARYNKNISSGGTP